MNIKRATQLNTIQGPAEYFVGNTWLNILVRNDNVPCSSAKVTFEPGSRTNWHTHPVCQILIVTEGNGFVQKKDEPVNKISYGDVVIIYPDEEHWHGATPDSLFTHIAIQLYSGKGLDVAWLSPVTDEEYNSF